MSLGVVASAHVVPAAAGGFEPDDLTGLQVWFDASDAATITASAGAVSQWNDKSTNARHVTQAVGGSQPTTGTQTINSKNVIRFDGTNDILATAGNVQIVNTTGGVWTGFVVCRPTTISGGTDIALSQDDATTRVWQMCRNAAGTFVAIQFSSSGGNVQPTEGSFVANTAVMQTVVSTTTEVDVWRNGVSSVAALTAGSNQTAARPLQVGSQVANYWAGDIAEIVIYNVALGTTDRQTVENYLRTKWGTP